MKELPKTRIKALRNALREGIRKDIPAEENAYHPAEDVEFLEALFADALMEQTLDEYRDHLAACPMCRHTMAIYVKSGAVEIVDIPVKSVLEKPRTRLPIRMSTVAAVGLILTLCLVLYRFPENVPPKNFVPEKSVAMAHLEKILTPEDRPVDCSIVAFGCLPNGLRPGKEFPAWNETHFSEVEQAFQTVLQETPNDVEVRLDYAAFLLFREQDITRTEKVLSETNAADEIRFHRLAGLVAFLKNDYVVAAEHFTTVWQRETPKLYGDGINLAASLFQLGECEKAIPLYRELLPMASNSQQRESLKKILESLEHENK